MRRLWPCLALALAFFGCEPKDSGEAHKAGLSPLRPEYAVLKTDKGAIVIHLFADKAPKTVANFIGLATGAKPWRDPRDGKTRENTPLYNGISFHRVIPGFMIQAGDPLGDGRGNVGFTIKDEFSPALRYGKPGMVGMASIGANSADSQFFITLAPTPQLNDHNTLFGEVVSGLDVAKAIAAVPRNTEDGSDRPLSPVAIQSVTITDKP